MSTWIEIKEADAVELSDDGKTIEVYIGSDHGGAIYVDIPLEFIHKAREPDN